MKNAKKSISTSGANVTPLTIEEGIAQLQNMKPLKKIREEALNKAVEPYRAEVVKAWKNGNSKTALIEMIYLITKRRISYKMIDEILVECTAQQEVAQ